MQFAHQVSAIENPMKLREARKLVARLNTELTAKEHSKIISSWKGTIEKKGSEK